MNELKVYDIQAPLREFYYSAQMIVAETTSTDQVLKV
jgi:flagellar biosynthesis regulator FlbT